MKLVWIAVLAAALSLISLAYTMHTRANDQSRLERVAKETHAALCTFKHAFEPIPGKTSYTKDSEVMNAETSAWGRAIVALGFETKKIASADEVRARSGAAPTGEKTESAPTAHEAGSTTAPDNPVVKAQAAAEAAKAARTPTDDGAPENVVLTFGKYKGSHLGAAPKAYLTWLTENFEAKNAEQRRIVAAANLLVNDPDDEIPF